MERFYSGRDKFETAQETHAETAKFVAAIDKQTAELEAQATVLLGEAEA